MKSRMKNDLGRAPKISAPTANAIVATFALGAAGAFGASAALAERISPYYTYDRMNVDPAINRGVTTIRIPGAKSNEPDELCVIPNKIPGSKKNKPTDDQLELCGFDFYADPRLAICPKAASTNPAVEIYEVPEVTDEEVASKNFSKKESFEKVNCARTESKRGGDKIAKLKSSITCSYTPSILFYYQLSKWLDDAGNVPDSVIRTMNNAEHKEVVAKGIKNVIGKSWALLGKAHADPTNFGVHTSDLKQLYGALSENPGGEDKYVELIGPPHPYSEGMKYFLATPAFKSISGASDIVTKLPKDLKGSAQAIQRMKDTSDMVLLDTLLAQQDRFGNIHKKIHYHYVDQSTPGKLEVVSLTKKKYEKALAEGSIKATDVVPVEEILLKDNDCGVAKSNRLLADKTIERVTHMSPKTYKKFMSFADKFSSTVASEELKEYLKTEMLFREADWTAFQKAAIYVRNTLKSRCQAGKLLLDLDIEQHLGFKEPDPHPCG